MKKILLMFMTLFFVLPFTNAFAEEISTPFPHDFNNGLLDDMEIIKFIDFPIEVYDNNLLTSQKGKPDSSFVRFKTPVNITGYYSNFAYLIQATIGFYFSDGTAEFVEAVPKGAFYKDLNYNNIVEIRMYKSSTISLNEIEFFGNYVLDDSIGAPVTNLTEVHNFNSIDVAWKNPVSDEIESLIIKSNGIEVASLANTAEAYSLTDLKPKTLYNLEVIVKYIDGSFSSSQKLAITTDEIPEDTIPPSEIKNVVYTQSSNGVNFNWENPTDSDFSHIKIYRDGVLMETNYSLNKYEVSNLIPNTMYVYKFVTVDTNGNSSSGYIQTIKTDFELDNVAPSSPTGLFVSVGNKSGNLIWTKNNESDIKGYNVYVDGVKHNSAMLLKNNYVITGLENGKKYSITVSAVDTSGNESEFSSVVFLTPNENSMPIFKPDFDLKAVADGTSGWFSSIWLIIAFAIAIPLAFIVSHRVKKLFFA